MRTLYVLGESHADGLIGAFVTNADGAVLAAMHVTHVPALAPNDFLDGDGRVHPKIVIALATARFLHYAQADQPEAIPHQFMGPNLYSPKWAQHFRLNIGAGAVPLLVVCGEIAARYVTAAIPVDADIDVPFPPETFAHVPGFAATRRVPRDSVDAAIDAQLAPMLRALVLLKNVGLRRIGLHSIPPCTSDDERYRVECGYDTRALTRLKVILLLNLRLREFCKREGLFFIDRWHDVTLQGSAREGVLLDAVHLRPEYMRPSAAAYYEAVANER